MSKTDYLKTVLDRLRDVVRRDPAMLSVAIRVGELFPDVIDAINAKAKEGAFVDQIRRNQSNAALLGKIVAILATGSTGHAADDAALRFGDLGEGGQRGGDANRLMFAGFLVLAAASIATARAVADGSRSGLTHSDRAELAVLVDRIMHRLDELSHKQDENYDEKAN
jgi:hypothetical protein